MSTLTGAQLGKKELKGETKQWRRKDDKRLSGRHIQEVEEMEMKEAHHNEEQQKQQQQQQQKEQQQGEQQQKEVPHKKQQEERQQKKEEQQKEEQQPQKKKKQKQREQEQQKQQQQEMDTQWKSLNKDLYKYAGKVQPSLGDGWCWMYSLLGTYRLLQNPASPTPRDYAVCGEVFRTMKRIAGETCRWIDLTDRQTLDNMTTPPFKDVRLSTTTTTPLTPLTPLTYHSCHSCHSHHSHHTHHSHQSHQSHHSHNNLHHHISPFIASSFAVGRI